MLVANWVLVGAMVVAVGVPARGEAACPTAQDVCDIYAPFLGFDCPTPTAFAAGDDWTVGVRAGEVVLSSTAGAGVFEASHEGTLATLPFPAIECGLIEEEGRTLLNIPAEGHCAVSLETRHHYYLWFLSDIEACHGWTECRCVDDDDDDDDHRGNRSHGHH